MGRKEDIAIRIKTMRMSRNMSQADLASALNCAQSTVAMWETGQREPNLETIDMIADIFNVAPCTISYSEQELRDIISTNHLAPEERRLVQLYRTTIPEIQSAIIQLMELNQIQRKASQA